MLTIPAVDFAALLQTTLIRRRTKDAAAASHPGRITSGHSSIHRPSGADLLPDCLYNNFFGREAIGRGAHPGGVEQTGLCHFHASRRPI